MATETSRFQTLPSLIVKQIVDYAVNQFRAGYMFDESMIISLLHVSSVWRAATLEIAFSDMTLIIDTEPSLIARFQNNSKLSIPIDQFDHSLVKTLRIGTNNQNVVSNSIFKSWMKLINSSGLYFSAADSIRIRISTCLDQTPIRHSSYGYYESRLAAEKALDAVPLYELALVFTEFMHNVRASLPSLSTAFVSLVIATDSSFPSNFDAVVDNCVVDFMHGLKHIMFSPIADTVCPQVSTSRPRVNLSLFSGLVQLKYCLVKQSGFTEVAHRSCNSLKTLNTCCATGSADHIIYTDSNEPVIYSSLDTLVLRGKCGNMTTNHDNNPGPDVDDPAIIHFPVIESLNMWGAYPFTFNALAREKNTTLKRIWATFTNAGHLIEGLDKFSILLSSKFIALESLSVYFWYKRDVNELGDFNNTSVSETIGKLLSFCTLRALYLSSNREASPISSKLLYGVKLNNLTLFDFSGLRILFSDIIFLLEKAPHLQAIKFSTDPADTVVCHMSSNEILDYVHTRIVPLNTRVRSISMTVDLPNKRIAQMLILLAIACPDITRISIQKLDRLKVLDEISTLLAAYPFSVYTDHCGKLLRFIK